MVLPQGFVELINSYDAQSLNGLAKVLQSTSPETSVRLNHAKGVKPTLQADIVPWWKYGIYLNERPAFTLDPALHQGLYYVQDASSMAVGAAINAVSALLGNAPLVYLDACAAPGGKTLAALDTLPAGSTVFTNEYDFRRATVLYENVAKWGNARAIVTRGDTARYSRLPKTFDIIAADVPCSGEGMMRKEPEAVAQWSPSLIADCAYQQRKIVDNLWPALRPGGYMIYSTCTFNRKENEENVEYICHEFGGSTVDIGLDQYDGITHGINTNEHCYRFIPGNVRGEGLFIAIIRKDGDSPRQPYKAHKRAPDFFAKAPVEASTAVKNWFDGNFEARLMGDKIVAVRTDTIELLTAVATQLDIISAGVTTATIKGHNLIPNQSAALTTSLKANAFPTIEVDYRTAMAFLRCENINIDSNVRGHILLSYKGRPLGFVKNLGNRANNLYPRTWRILTQNIPSEPPAKPFYLL